MDLITPDDLKELAEPIEHGPAVSLFMPTQRIVVDVDADPLRWKNLLTGVAAALHEEGVAKTEVDALLEAAWDLHTDYWAWQHMSDGLAVFLRPGWHRIFRVPVDVPQVAAVGDRFLVSPLLGAISSEDHFLLLAVSQRKVRLLEGTRDRIEEVELREVPTSLSEVIEGPEPRSDTMARTVFGGGKAGPAVFYGHGAADDDFKKDDVMRFLRRVADGLQTYLADQNRPMVLVGLDQLVGAYREVNHYQFVLDQTIDRNPDQLSADELHEASWPIVAGRFTQAKLSAVERFGQLRGTGQASVDETEIEVASSQGRVESLFLADEPSCWDQAVGHGRGAVTLGADESFATCERVDRAVVATMTNGGSVFSIVEPPMFDGGSMAATFRY